MPEYRIKNETRGSRLRSAGLFSAKDGTRVCTTIAIAILLIVATGSHVRAQDDSRNTQATADALKVERYLESLGLEDLLIQHLEQQFASDLNEQSRRRLAGRLAELYSGRLMMTGLEPGTPEVWRKKAKSLFDRSPGLKAPELQIAMSHAWYQEVNHRFQEWWLAGADPALRPEIVNEWRNLIRELLEQYRASDKIRRDLVNLDGNAADADDPVARQIVENENIYLQTNYLLGWACYFRSIAETTQRDQWTAMSEDHFRLFLQITQAKPLEELTAEWFDFNSPWTPRAIVGLAMCVQARGNEATSDRLFALSLASGDKSFAASLDSWRLSSAAYVDQYKKAEEILASHRTSQNQSAEFGFRILSVRIGNAIRIRDREVAGRLFDSGLIALARMGNTKVIDALLATVDPGMITGSSFESDWIVGFVESGRAAETGDIAQLNAARVKLEQAIGRANESSNPDDVARCQYSLGWIHYRQRQFDEAAGLFESAAGQLRESDRDLAAEALWFQIQSLIQISRKNPGQTARAFSAMDRMLNWFPGMQYASRVKFEKLRLESAALSPGDAMRRLQLVSPDNEDYFRAVYEMTGIQYEMWLRAYRSNSPTAVALLTRLEELALLYRNQPQSSDELKLKAILLVVDAKLKTAARRNDNRVEEAAVLLDEANSIALPMKDIPLQSAGYVEYRYYRFLFERQRGMPDLETDAQWLVDNAKGLTFENTALIYLAKRNDVMIDEPGLRAEILDGIIPDSAEVERGIELYNRLAGIAGISSDELARSSNSRFITARLAELYYLEGSWKLADDLNRMLLEQWPLQQNYLVQTARVKMKLGDYPTARDSWRKIASAVEAGTDVWYEAKFQLVNCLARIAPESALPLYRQTMQLSPDMPDEWRERFDKLGATLEQ